MRTIVVEPAADAWAVRVDDVEPQLFVRGREAEAAARKLAEKLAASGEQVEIQLFLRNGEKAARFICLPPASKEDRPLLVGGSLLARVAVRGFGHEARRADRRRLESLCRGVEGPARNPADNRHILELRMRERELT